MPLSSDSNKLDFENKNEIWIDIHCVLNELQISWMKTKYLRYLNSLKIIKIFSKFNRWKKKRNDMKRELKNYDSFSTFINFESWRLKN